jgi:hypothetical protein
MNEWAKKREKYELCGLFVSFKKSGALFTKNSNSSVEKIQN